LYIHPIKSLRPIALRTALLTPTGLLHDRRYMLFRYDPTASDPKERLSRMTVTYVPRMGLFTTALVDVCGVGEGNERFVVRFHPPPPDSALRGDERGDAKVDGEKVVGGGEQEEKEIGKKTLEMSFQPDISSLEEIEVSLHGSGVKARNMGPEINAWFSACFGWEVVCVYMPEGRTREVLGNLSPAAVPSENGEEKKKSWFSALTPYMPEYIITGGKGDMDEKQGQGITFADCAPYLVVTEESIGDVSTRLPDGIQADVTKFRPNIVLEGAEEAYEEDFWAGISISPNGSTDQDQDQELEITLTQNCIRCQSLDIDYETGRFGKGVEKTVLKKLMRDRRVDGGKKHSPVFGRYGFLKDGGSKEGVTVSVGDEVRVTRRNQERTKFYNLSTKAELPETLKFLGTAAALCISNRRSRMTDEQNAVLEANMNVSLEDGISNLYDSVDDAIQHFSHIEHDFDQDTHRIRNYCTKRVLDALWMQKVRPAENMPHDRQRNAPTRGHPGEQEDASQSAPSLRNTIRQLMSSLGAALASAEQFHPSQRRPSRYSADDAVKIRQQLHRSYQSLRKSFSVVMEKRSEMESLKTELEMLRVFLSRNGADENRDGGGGGGGGFARVGGSGRHRGGAPHEEHDEHAWDERGEQGQEWGGGTEEGGHGKS
ncbi:MAG: hypothetical protein Q9216_007020, partial [Gyalolechia sp. 2 TL-2023]